jgi:hypothetical protein
VTPTFVRSQSYVTCGTCMIDTYTHSLKQITYDGWNQSEITRYCNEITSILRFVYTFQVRFESCPTSLRRSKKLRTKPSLHLLYHMVLCMVFIIHTHDTGRQDDRTAGQAPSSFIDRYIDTDCTYRLQTYCMYTKRRSAVQLF